MITPAAARQMGRHAFDPRIENMADWCPFHTSHNRYQDWVDGWTKAKTKYDRTQAGHEPVGILDLADDTARQIHRILVNACTQIEKLGGVVYSVTVDVERVYENADQKSLTIKDVIIKLNT